MRVCSLEPTVDPTWPGDAGESSTTATAATVAATVEQEETTPTPEIRSELPKEALVLVSTADVKEKTNVDESTLAAAAEAGQNESTLPAATVAESVDVKEKTNVESTLAAAAEAGQNESTLPAAAEAGKNELADVKEKTNVESTPAAAAEDGNNESVDVTLKESSVELTSAMEQAEVRNNESVDVPVKENSVESASAMEQGMGKQEKQPTPVKSELEAEDVKIANLAMETTEMEMDVDENGGEECEEEQEEKEMNVDDQEEGDDEDGMDLLEWIADQLFKDLQQKCGVEPLELAFATLPQTIRLMSACSGTGSFEMVMHTLVDFINKKFVCVTDGQLKAGVLTILKNQ